ncbi:hypothetical protein ACJX0J_021966, partial [Zea mays]
FSFLQVSKGQEFVGINPVACVYILSIWILMMMYAWCYEYILDSIFKGSRLPFFTYIYSLYYAFTYI